MHHAADVLIPPPTRSPIVPATHRPRRASLRSVRWPGIAWTLVLVLGLGMAGHAAPVQSQTVDTLWIETFESDWASCWGADFGTWEVGTPTIGPGSAYRGTGLAATVLGGNYVEGVDSKFIRFCTFVVPTADQHPRLRFWQWFSISNDDWGAVMVQPSGGPWQTIGTFDRTSAGHWTRGFADLTPFAGQTVKVAFHFHSEASFFCSPCVGPGWYIDDVMVETGDRVLPAVEDWESGFAGWYAEHGLWEVGAPSSGPGDAHSGGQVAGTILDGNYPEDHASRLISPPFVVPSPEQYPRLRFWHWFSLASDDTGSVQVRVNGGAWQTLEAYDRHSCSRWTRGFVDLAAYAGSSVEVGFLFASHSSFFCSPCVSSGWYLDDVTVETGPEPLDNIMTWDGPEGIGAWYADRGVWEVGKPTSGPGTAYSDSICAATILDGDYSEDLDGRLISPPFLFRPLGNAPYVRFAHWYNFASDDFGYVQVRAGRGPWQTIAGPYGGSGGPVWTYPPPIDLTTFADSTRDSTIQVCFYLASRSSFFCSPCVASGWYVDDVRIDGVVAMTPVLIAQESAVQEGDDVIVAWSTSAEVGVSGFRVDRSRGGVEFESLSPLIPARGPGEYSYRDQAVQPGHYVYRIVEVDIDGSETPVAMVEIDVRGGMQRTFLDPAEPNPFGSRTVLRFGLAEAGEAVLGIYDLGGRRVRTLARGTFRPEPRTETWDGRDQQGKRLPPGVYYASLKTRTATVTRRLVLLD